MVTEAPCLLCESNTRSHEIVPGCNLCHKCFSNLRSSDRDRIKKKVTKIVSTWVDQKILLMLQERDMVSSFERPENVDYDALNKARLERLKLLKEIHEE